jgi:NAD(P)-dependent dehydrogenase (short-subunit alcohol dehydrogenase family)
MNDIFSLNNKNIIITGGLGLLGKKHIESIIEYNGNPIILDIIPPKDAQLILNQFEVNGKKLIYFQCDISNELAIENVKNHILTQGLSIDGLINNAAIDPKVSQTGINNTSRLEFFSYEQWQLELNVGLTGAMLCSKIFGYEMATSNGGSIINISSDLGIIAPNQNLYKQNNIADDKQSVKPVTYSVIKHGLIGLTKYIATYWADKGVRCNSLCPGGIYNNQNPDFVQKISHLIPMGRMANADEYKGAIIFLLSQASSYMNGETMVIDGGRSIW